MNRREYLKTVALGAMATPTLLRRLTRVEVAGTFTSSWDRWPDVRWAGPHVWANRLQDWRIRDGAVECTEFGANRTLHCLTHRLSDDDGAFEASVEVDVPDAAATQGQYVGWRVGAQGPYEDYRSAAVFGEGLDLGMTMNGRLIVGDTEGADRFAPESVHTLRLQAQPGAQGYQLSLEAQAEDGTILSRVQVDDRSADTLVGTVALVSHRPPGDGSSVEGPAVRFRNWTMQGAKLLEDPEAAFGPVCFAQYTLHRETLKLTAQLAPVEQIDGARAVLEVQRDGAWAAVAESAVDPLARIARFRVEDWAADRAVPYRVRLILPLRDGRQDFLYHGTIAREPGPDDPVRLAVFSCNADHGFPDADVVRHVQKHEPDAAVFLGDQFYEGTGGFGVQRSPVDDAALDMLHKWYMFGWSYRDLFRDIPAAVIPDDHDVYHGNVWGEGGADAPVEEGGWGYDSQDAGGYKMAPTWVNVVQRVQTSHLPDPHDPTPVKQGIGVYYTDWLYGGVSFAILEDRKFKSPPKEILPEEAEVVNGFITNPEFDITDYDTPPEANLLGERQQSFLADWAEDWSGGAQMKAVLSQTNFASVHTLPEGATSDQMVPDLPLPEPGEYVEGDAPVVDMDTNGWPPNRRDAALRRLRSCRAFHIAGDQHLATTVRYGIEDFDDAGFAFTGPALNNIWPRRWWPSPEEKQKPLSDADNPPAYTGSFFDGFDNRITVHAAANPHRTGRTPSILYDRMTGYGIVTFDTARREIQIECWPRYADPSDGPEGQYDGWPMTVTQADGDGREPAAYLPALDIRGLDEPVVQVIDDASGEPLYTVRRDESTVRPAVFREEGTYTVRLGDGARWLRTLESIDPLPPGEQATRVVEVSPGASD
ncbi:MAG: alkaline phosphatase D family protein [Salinibacter sp.]|uniref:alkaline phosphatase D family protein n=1 Tax=Salinibacter sp. TaxID=2065818 RepID=UPI002FC2BCDA